MAHEMAGMAPAMAAWARRMGPSMSFAVVVVAWVAMMAAMMLPAILPVVNNAEGISLQFENTNWIYYEFDWADNK